MKKYRRVCFELLRLRLQNLMVFRLDFFGPFFVDGSLFLIQLMAFHAIYDNIDQVGNWKSGEMILYIGTFSLLNAISMTICFFGIIQIPDKIKSGEMDLYLTKPISPLFRLTFECFSPGSIPLILFSIGLIFYGISESRIHLSIQNAIVYIFWVLLMEILYYDMEVLIRSISFYIISGARMEQLEDAGLSLCMKLPGIAFYGVYKIIFYLLIPYGIMATFPVQSLVGEMTLWKALYGIAIVILFSMLTSIIWNNGKKRYQSASS